MAAKLTAVRSSDISNDNCELQDIHKRFRGTRIQGTEPELRAADVETGNRNCARITFLHRLARDPRRRGGEQQLRPHRLPASLGTITPARK